MITVCEAREEDGFSEGDVLIFPEMIKYRYVITKLNHCCNLRSIDTCIDVQPQITIWKKWYIWM